MPIPSTPLDLGGRPARAEAYDVLLAEIVTGRLAPGARLDDADLLTLTSGSRAPLREALNRLADVWLVEVVPRRSTRVAPLDLRRTRECADVLAAVVERAMRESVATLTERDRRDLQRLRTASLSDAADTRAAMADATLGRAVAAPFLRAAGNAEYVRLEARVRPTIERHVAVRVALLDPEAWRARLAEVVDAALDGDVDGAVAAWREHAERSSHSLPGGEDQDPVVPVAPTLRERASLVIQEAIIDGTLVPGEVLRESDLMAWLGISRTPVREALTTLADRGLVVQAHHRPATVATLDEESSRASFRALGVLRLLALDRGLATRPDELAAELGEALAAWESAGSADERLAAADRTSAVLERTSGSIVLQELTSTVNARVRWHAVHRLGLPGADEPVWLRSLVRAVEGRRAHDVRALVADVYGLE